MKMLRGISSLQFGVVKGKELPLFRTRRIPTPASIEHIYLGPFLEARFKSLVQGSSKVVHLWKMYTKLLAYAQTFERNPDFKEQMFSPYGEARRRLDPLHQRPRDPSRTYPWHKQRPFNFGSVFHPVEDMLEHASLASETGDKKEFKLAGQALLEFS